MASEPIHPLTPTDEQLVRRASGGDRDAFHELVDRHAGRLFGLAVQLLGNSADAEDVLQESLIGAFTGLRSFRAESSVKTWLTRILIRQVARFFRKRGRRRVVPFDPQSMVGPTVGPAESTHDAQVDVHRAMEKLAPEHREVIVLREFHGLAYDEIAEVLELPQGTVESRLWRARRALAELLKEYVD